MSTHRPIPFEMSHGCYGCCCCYRWFYYAVVPSTCSSERCYEYDIPLRSVWFHSKVMTSSSSKYCVLRAACILRTWHLRRQCHILDFRWNDEREERASINSTKWNGNSSKEIGDFMARRGEREREQVKKKRCNCTNQIIFQQASTTLTKRKSKQKIKRRGETK